MDDADQRSYDLVAIRMIALAETEPALRTAWLMACDRIERELVGIVADRLGRPADDGEVRMHAATTNSVVRVINEDVSIALMAGADPASIADPLERMAQAMRVAPPAGPSATPSVPHTEAETVDREVTMESMKTKERQVEGGERGDAVLERVLAQRERHRGRSIFVRAGVVVAGGAVSVLAVPLLLAPEFGLPLLLFGLRLLALESDRAARLYVRVEKLARGAWGLLRRLLKSMFKSKRRIAVTVVLWLAVTAAGTALVL